MAIYLSMNLLLKITSNTWWKFFYAVATFPPLCGFNILFSMHVIGNPIFLIKAFPHPPYTELPVYHIQLCCLSDTKNWAVIILENVISGADV